MELKSYGNPPLIFVIGLNYKTAPLGVREKIFFKSEEIPAQLDRFRDVLQECMIISTCNRTELYGVSWNQDFKIDQIKKMLAQSVPEGKNTGDYFYNYILRNAVTHLFKVATSIDSMVVGDSQIMAQVKEAYGIANNNGSTGKILNQLLQKALHTAKRAKNETELFEGAFSVSYAAVELAMKIFGELEGKNILVIGAGKTSELTVYNLAKKNASGIFVTNRTKENADKMVNRLNERYSLGASVIEFNSFKSFLNKIDIIISSTGSGNYILNYDEFKTIAKQRHGNPIFLVDIAVPRDVDPAINKLNNVFLKNIDDLNALVDSNYDKRMSVIPEVEKIVSQEVSEFLNWYYTIPVLPAIQYIQKNCDGGVSAEMKRVRDYISSNIYNFQHEEFVRSLNKLNSETLDNCYRVAKGEIEICPRTQKKCPATKNL